MLKSIVCLICIVCLFWADSAEAKPCRKAPPQASANSGTFSTNALEGRRLGDLYIAYTGIRGRIPAKVTTDPVRQLDSLWQVKIACYNEASVVRTIHRELLSEYRRNRTYRTLDQFIQSAESEVNLVRSAIDWRTLGSTYNLSDEQLTLVRNLALQVSGKDLVAYGMTEIMPSDDGKLNVQVLDFLVRNYGPEFVYAIPAIHDKYASFGFYQFTSFAVYDDGKRIEGASMVSRTLRTGRISGSTKDIKGSIQHRTAYLFAIHNIALLVKAVSNSERKTLSKLPNKNHDDLIQYIAAAHNGPSPARKGARRWLAANMKYDYFVSVSRSAVRRYAVKTKANLAALRYR